MNLNLASLDLDGNITACAAGHSACPAISISQRSSSPGDVIHGHHYDVDYCFIFELRDGLIARVREYMDTLKGARMVFGSLDRVPAA